MGSGLISGFKGKSGKRHGKEFHCSARLLQCMSLYKEAQVWQVLLARRHGGSLAMPCGGHPLVDGQANTASDVNYIKSHLALWCFKWVDWVAPGGSRCISTVFGGMKLFLNVITQIFPN